MEWLKELLEKAQITDGKLNVDEVMELQRKSFLSTLYQRTCLMINARN